MDFIDEFANFGTEKFNFTRMECSVVTDRTVSGKIKRDANIFEFLCTRYIISAFSLVFMGLVIKWLFLWIPFILTVILIYIYLQTKKSEHYTTQGKIGVEDKELPLKLFSNKFFAENEENMNIFFTNSKDSKGHERVSDIHEDDVKELKDKLASEYKMKDSSNNGRVKCIPEKEAAGKENAQKYLSNNRLKCVEKNLPLVHDNCNVKIKEKTHLLSLENEYPDSSFIFSLRNFNIKLNISVHHLLAPPFHPPDIDGIPWPFLKEEKWRLYTFAKYPHKAKKSAIILAGNGFAYHGTGHDDNVICYFCCIKKGNWNEKDNISNVHSAMSPNCSMVTGINCTNVPMMKYYPKEGLGLFSNFQHAGKPVEPGAAKSEKENEDIEDDGISTANHHHHSVATERSQSTHLSCGSASSGISRPPGHVQMATRSVGQPASSTSQQQSGDQAPVVAASGTVAQQVTNGDATSITILSNGLIQSINTDENSPPGTTEAQNSSGSHPGENIQSSASASSSGSNAVPVSNANNPASQEAQAGSRLNSQNPAAPPATTAPPAAAPAAPPADPPTDPPATVNSQPTYSQLGIMTERPKRFEYAVRETRLQTFDGWPPGHKLKPADLADAGFYYAGYSDCARCFFCGGGLRNWEPNDNVWVEHARWFPKCTYIRQNVGQAFVTAVEQLNKTQDDISYEDVMRKLGPDAKNFHLDSKDNPLLRDPAVRTILDSGFSERDVFEAANTLKSAGETLSSDKIYEKLVHDNKPRKQVDVSDSRSLSSAVNVEKDKETIKELKSENGELRKQTVCKVCWDKEVTMVFLPCGHFVSCTDCASALRDCPMCRTNIKGVVRAYMN